LPEEIIKEYTIHHDCGKFYCKIIDDNGKQHFPNHAEVSAKLWLEIGGSKQAASLMGKDMIIHTMKAIDVDQFIKSPEAITLLIVGLAEIIANSQMFGGFTSTSFKIKYKHLDQRGKAITKKLYGENNVIDIKN
jgi:hypothetical protein